MRWDGASHEATRTYINVGFQGFDKVVGTLNSVVILAFKFCNISVCPVQ
jgi:hypothetical protein